MKLHAISGLTWGCPYCAVGIQRALESAIGLPSRSTSALWMLAFLIPAEVRRSFIVPPEVIAAGGNVLGAYGSVRARDWQTTENSPAPPDPASRLQGPLPNAGPGEAWPSRRRSRLVAYA